MKDFKNLTIGELENKIAELQELKEQIKAKPNWRDEFKGEYYPYLNGEGKWTRHKAANYPNHYKKPEHIPLEKIALLCDMEEWARVHNEGWLADWNNEYQQKWGIGYNENFFRVDCAWECNYFVFQIALKSKELAEQFYNEFKDRLHIINK